MASSGITGDSGGFDEVKALYRRYQCERVCHGELKRRITRMAALRASGRQRQSQSWRNITEYAARRSSSSRRQAPEHGIWRSGVAALQRWFGREQRFPIWGAAAATAFATLLVAIVIRVGDPGGSSAIEPWVASAWPESSGGEQQAVARLTIEQTLQERHFGFVNDGADTPRLYRLGKLLALIPLAGEMRRAGLIAKLEQATRVLPEKLSNKFAEYLSTLRKSSNANARQAAWGKLISWLNSPTFAAALNHRQILFTQSGFLSAELRRAVLLARLMGDVSAFPAWATTVRHMVDAAGDAEWPDSLRQRWASVASAVEQIHYGDAARLMRIQHDLDAIDALAGAAR